MAILLTTTCSASASGGPAPEVFIGLAGTTGFNVIADMDGDGQDEVVMTSDRRAPTFPSETGTTFAVAGRISPGAWGLRSMLHDSLKIDAQPIVLRRAGGDAVLFYGETFSTQSGYSIDLYLMAGLPIGLQKIASGTRFTRLSAAADLDADGDFDWVESGPETQAPYEQQTRVYDLASAQLLWSRTLAGSSSTAAALDQDAALEIVIAGQTGYILDGATGATEWSYAAGLVGPTLVGNFDADPASIEFTGGGPGNTVIVFGVAPYTPLTDFNIGCCIFPAASADLDGDGVDEIVLNDWSTTKILNPVDGSIRSHLHDATAGGYLSIGNVDASGPALVRSGNYAGGRGWAAKVLDPATFDVLQGVRQVPPGPLRVAIHDVDPAPGEELIVAVPITDPYGDRLEIRSADGEEVLRSVDFPNLGNPEPYIGLDIVVAQWDADVQPEIALTMSTNMGSEVRVVDSIGLQTQVQFRLQDAANGNSDVYPITLRVTDVDADGTNELVAIDGYSSPIRLYVFDAQSGVMEWRSVAYETSGPAQVFVVQADADTALEMLLWTGSRLFTIDGASHVVEASQTVGAGLFFARDDGGECRLALVSSSNNLHRASCANPQFLSLGTPLPGITRWADFALPSGGDIVAVVDDRLVYVRGNGRSETLASGLGWRAGEFQRGAARSGNNDPGTVVVANDGVIRVRGLAMPLLSDGFE